MKKHQLVSATAAFAVGSGLIIAGFYTPPRGQIHPSVLIVAGEMLTFVATLMGFTYHWGRK